MYHGSGDPRGARRALDTPAGFSPEATARAVLARLRKLLDAYTPDRTVQRTLPEALGAKLDDAEVERERLFLRGFWHWWNEEPAAAEPLLAEARERAREQNAVEALAESAYWLARLRLRMGRGEALAEYEDVLRTLGGSPRATAWFVDLLLRAGRIDRAEQVWKSVRGNRRVAGCPRRHQRAASCGSSAYCSWPGSRPVRNSTSGRWTCCAAPARGRIPPGRCGRGRTGSSGAVAVKSSTKVRKSLGHPCAIS